MQSVVREQTKTRPEAPKVRQMVPTVETVQRRPAERVSGHKQRSVRSRPVRRERRQAEEANEKRIQRELKELQETEDLREIDDDVEDVATLLDWTAPAHTHRPTSPLWFIGLAVATTLMAIFFVATLNIAGAITTALVGGVVYLMAQRPAPDERYRIMTEGIAINTSLYHYRDLEDFNIIYQPGEVKTVILRSKRRLLPLMHLELGDMDPLVVRDMLLQFLEENDDLEEPLIDSIARRVGF